MRKFILCLLMLNINFAHADEYKSIKEQYVDSLYNSPNLLKQTNPVYQNDENHYYYNNHNDIQNKSNVKFAIEYGVSIFAHSTVEEQVENLKSEQKEVQINNSGYFAIGLDMNGFQLGFAPRFVEIEDTSKITMFQFAFDIPLSFDETQPFIEIGAQYANMEIETSGLSISESAFGYFVGGGIKHYISNNLFIKVMLLYNTLDFDTKIYGYDFNMNTSGFELTTSIGYRF